MNNIKQDLKSEENNIIKKSKRIKGKVTIFDKIKIIGIKNVSPLRYPGGKTRACDKLNDIMKQHFNMNNYITLLSPFFWWRII